MQIFKQKIKFTAVLFKNWFKTNLHIARLTKNFHIVLDLKTVNNSGRLYHKSLLKYVMMKISNITVCFKIYNTSH